MAAGAAATQSTTVPQYFCPSRRPATTRPGVDGTPIGLNDYAMPVWKDPTAGPGKGGGNAGCWNWSTLRCSMYGPMPDQPLGKIAYWQLFGSAHAEGINAAFADGSVRSIRYDTVNAIFQLLCRKDDGQLIDATAL